MADHPILLSDPMVLTLRDGRKAKSAHISDCGLYRYSLGRLWGAGKKVLAFVLLNPSTADADVDDPPIRRCVFFAKREGFEGIHVCNIHAFRTTRPEGLKQTMDPVGRQNAAVLSAMAGAAALDGRPIVCAWGASGDIVGAYLMTLKLLRASGARLTCLGVTANGMPRHPLYVSGDQPLVDFGLAP